MFIGFRSHSSLLKCYSSSDQGWSCCREQALVSSGWCSLLSCELGVPQRSLGVLSDLITEDILVWLDQSLDDKDTIRSCMSTCHLVVHLRYGCAESVVSVLVVHVNYAGSGKI